MTSATNDRRWELGSVAREECGLEARRIEEKSKNGFLMKTRTPLATTDLKKKKKRKHPNDLVWALTQIQLLFS